MSNSELLAAAKKAVQELFSDQSVSREQCRENLDEIGADIVSYNDALDADDMADEATDDDENEPRRP